MECCLTETNFELAELESGDVGIPCSVSSCSLDQVEGISRVRKEENKIECVRCRDNFFTLSISSVRVDFLHCMTIASCSTSSCVPLVRGGGMSKMFLIQLRLKKKGECEKGNKSNHRINPPWRSQWPRASKTDRAASNLAVPCQSLRNSVDRLRRLRKAEGKRRLLKRKKGV